MIQRLCDFHIQILHYVRPPCDGFAYGLRASIRKRPERSRPLARAKSVIRRTRSDFGLSRILGVMGMVTTLLPGHYVVFQTP